jgi:hypothetical protein
VTPRVAALIAVAVAAGGCMSSATEPTRDAGSPPPLQAVLLTLDDLPRGYRIGNDDGCGEVGTEGASERVARFVVEERPRLCLRSLGRVWAPRDGPGAVFSGAMAFRDERGARRGLGEIGELVRYLGITAGEPRAAEAPVGEETIAFDAGRRPGGKGSGVAWRDEARVGFTIVEGAESDAADALRLARVQRARMVGETAPPQAEMDDREVALDDPALRLPVYWLGRSFRPGNGLPELRLYDALVGELPYPGASPGQGVKIDYERGVTLDLFEPAAWQRVRRTKLGRLVWGSPCARSRRIELRGGYALIHAGYGVEPGGRCPSAPPDRYVAHVYFDGVVVVVNMAYCYMCAPRPQEPDPYDSDKGMAAIARGLVRR